MKKICKAAAVSLCSLALCASLAAPVGAESGEGDVKSAVYDVGVYVNGESFASDECVLIDSVTRVPFRKFCGEISGGEAVVDWEAETSTAVATWRGMTVTARAGEPYIIANGRAIYCIADNYIEDGTMMVAVRPMAKAFGVDVEWEGEERHVFVTGDASPIASADAFYDKSELFWLSRIISAESRGEPLLGKLAVGAVIYNRVDSELYPDNVYDVIFDMKYGIQFTPAYTAEIYREPTEESVIAAKLCMEGYRYNSDMLFFCTEAVRPNCWMGRNRPYILSIGNHAFFA